MTDDVDALIAWHDEMFTAWGEDAFATMAAKHRNSAAALRAQQERIDALEAERDFLREGLRDIAEPARSILRGAALTGSVINGHALIAITNDPAFLTNLAKATLTGEKT